MSARAAVEGETVVRQFGHVEVVLDTHGFLARCTTDGWMFGHVASVTIASAAARDHAQRCRNVAGSDGEG